MANNTLKNDAINKKYYGILNQFLMLDEGEESRYEIKIEKTKNDYHVKFNGQDNYGCFTEHYDFIFDSKGLVSYRDLTNRYIGLNNIQTIAKLDKLIIDNHLIHVFRQIVDSFDELLKNQKE